MNQISNIPTSAIINIHRFAGPKVLYLGKSYFDEIQKIKDTFNQHPIVMSFNKSINYFHRSPHWPSPVRVEKNGYFSRKTQIELSGKEYIGKNLWQAKRIIKKSINKRKERPDFFQYGPYPYSDEVYLVTNIKAYDLKLETDKDRLELYQILWGKYH